MAKIQLFRSSIDAARERCSLAPQEHADLDALLGANTGSMSIDVDRLPVALARALLDEPRLKPNQRGVLALYAHGMRADDAAAVPDVYALRVASPSEFAATVDALPRRPAAELYWNGRWYPVVLTASLHEDESKLAKRASLNVSLGLGQARHDLVYAVGPALFSDDAGRPVEPTVLDVLQQLGFRRLQIRPAAYNLRLVAAERLASTHGAQVWVCGAVLVVAHRVWFAGGGASLTAHPLGSADVPRRAVVEPTLDAEAGDRSQRFGVSQAVAGGHGVSRLPLVRVFSLDVKNYVYADVDDLTEYDYDATALDRLYLPPDLKHVLRQVFETPPEHLFGDVIRGKHGGSVILASGPPGVGKTLTAEVYAEMTGRPLYVLEFGELGTAVKEIEESLQRVFARVVRWRAVLQFDECEVFLSHRGADLERSAIVGIFLRLLDYYQGLLFLTTNRYEALDAAVRSRVMLWLEYPPLDPAGRARVWQTMFAAAGLTLADGTFDDLAEPDLNGRQIRNLVRLARILHPGRAPGLADVRDLLRFGCR